MSVDENLGAGVASGADSPIDRVRGFRRSVHLRDLGGHIGADGRMVKRGLIYRSAALGKASPSELAILDGLGLAHVLDLRSKTEADKLPDPEIPGAEYIRIAGAMDADDNEIDMSVSRIFGMFTNPRRVDDDPEDSVLSQIAEIYSSLAFRNIAYQHLFDQLESENVPILFHCTNGKDRTGVAALLILLALGVDDESIVADYAFSNRYLSELIQKSLDEHRFLANLSVFATAIRAKEGVLPEFGARVLDEIKQEHGDYATFFEKEYGLTPERIERLRDLYLE